MGKISITCEEAGTICTKSQYGEATLVEKIKLNIHFTYCKTCRLFTKQNTELSGVCRIVKGNHENDKHCLSAEEKEKLKAQLKEFEK